MAYRSKFTREQRDWMLARIETCGSINYALDIFEEEFGIRPTKNTVYQWSHKAGLHMGSKLPKDRDCLATRAIRWRSEPELAAWMLENDDGRPRANVRDDFRREFGFDVTVQQITAFRQAYGVKTKSRKRNNARAKPLGTRRVTKGGVLVKVREYADEPSTKDNWEYEHHMVWEAANGKIPDGHIVIFIDGDTTNSDIGNLYCMDRKVIPIVNQIGWHDRESLEFAVAQAALKTAIQDAYMREKVCKVCGRPFKPWNRGTKAPQVTCRECLDAGRKGRGDRSPKGEAVCAVCGEPFTKYVSTQVRCQACIDARPKHCVAIHSAIYERTGVR